MGLQINTSPSQELHEFYLWSAWELFFLQGEIQVFFSFLSIMQCHTKNNKEEKILAHGICIYL